MDDHHVLTFEAQDRYDPTFNWNREEVTEIARFRYISKEQGAVIRSYADSVGRKIACRYDYDEFDYDEFCTATEIGAARLEYERQQRAQLYIGRIAGAAFARQGIGLTNDIGPYIQKAREESTHFDKISSVYLLDVDDYEYTTIRGLFAEAVLMETTQEIHTLSQRFGTQQHAGRKRLFSFR